VPPERSRSLQQAASVLFVLMALLPLLIFTWLLYRLEALGRFEAQVGLTVALALALAGFVIFRRLMRQLSDFVLAMSRVADARTRGEAGVGAAVAPTPRLPTVAAPAIGTIAELADLTATMGAVWAREAAPHVGHRVLVSIVRATEPLSGTLTEVTDDGLIMDRDGAEVAIGFARIAGIERG
jgi:hypothetical protein